MIPPLGLILHRPESFDCMDPAFHLLVKKHQQVTLSILAWVSPSRGPTAQNWPLLSKSFQAAVSGVEVRQLYINGVEPGSKKREGEVNFSKILILVKLTTLLSPIK